MSGDETPASLLLRDAKINLQVSDTLAEHLPEAPFQHEVYFQAFYAVEKAVKAICDICGIAVKNDDWNKQIKTHDISKLLQMIEGNSRLDEHMLEKLVATNDEIPYSPSQKYPDLGFKTIPHESFTQDTANAARSIAHQFVSEVETWVAARL